MLRPLTSPRCSLSLKGSQQCNGFSQRQPPTTFPWPAVHHRKMCIHFALFHFAQGSIVYPHDAFSTIVIYSCDPHTFWFPTSQILLPSFHFLLSSFYKWDQTVLCFWCVATLYDAICIPLRADVSSFRKAEYLSICYIYFYLFVYWRLGFFPYLHWCELCFNKHMGKSNLSSIFQFIWI